MASIYGTESANILTGSSGDDLLYGRGGADLLSGRDGNDRLNGGAGDDTMHGGAGDDIYYVDNPFDRVIELEGQGYDTVRTTTDYSLAFGSSVELLRVHNALGTEAIFLVGNELANRLHGNAGRNDLTGEGGSDTLHGLGGDDRLIGGPGSDRLSGGPGKDVFVFMDLSWDRIYDFVSGQDRIELGWLMTASDFDFIGSAPFSGEPGEGRFATGKFQLDLNGDRVADLSITVAGALVAGDFDFSDFSSSGDGGAWDY